MVFPAPAGMNRVSAARVDCASCVPRACGDEPPFAMFLIPSLMCSPRLRG